MVLLITYEISDKSRNLTELHKVIKSTGNWWHHIDTSWIIQTTEDANKWYNKLKPHFKDADRFLVVKITEHHQGWLTEDAWKWLRNRNYD